MSVCAHTNNHYAQSFVFSFWFPLSLPPSFFSVHICHGQPWMHPTMPVPVGISANILIIGASGTSWVVTRMVYGPGGYRYRRGSEFGSRSPNSSECRSSSFGTEGLCTVFDGMSFLIVLPRAVIAPPMDLCPSDWTCHETLHNFN